MQLVEREALVMYTPAQMYALVNDVARYPEFLPWCVSSSVQEISATERLASLKIARSVLRTSFTTRNTLQADRRILMHLSDGPFKKLIGEWSFAAIGDQGSRVTFNVEFEFDNALMAAALGSTFESVCAAMLDAFVARAKSIYG